MLWLSVAFPASATTTTQQWLLVSDIHLDPFATYPGPAPGGDDTNRALLISAISAMRAEVRSPAVVILAGDFLAHQFESISNDAGVVPAAAAERTMREIASRFAVAFPKARFLVLVGNNDDPCGDYRSTPGSAYFKELARIWAPLVDRRNAAADFAESFANTGAYTARLTGTNLRAVVVDSVLWSPFFRGCGGAIGAGGELTWLSQTLRSTPKGMRNLVIMHIPPGVDPLTTLSLHGVVTVPFLFPGRTNALTELFADPSNRVAFAIASHMHRSDFRVFGNVPMLLVPSISPIYRNAPTFEVADVARGGSVQDLHAFSFDGIGHWHYTYDFDKAYGVHQLSAASFQVIHQRIASDPTLLGRWALHFDGDYSFAPSMDSVTWRYFWCAQTEVDGRYAICSATHHRSFTLFAVLAFVALAVVVVITIEHGRRSPRHHS